MRKTIKALALIMAVVTALSFTGCSNKWLNEADGNESEPGLYKNGELITPWDELLTEAELEEVETSGILDIDEKNHQNIYEEFNGDLVISDKVKEIAPNCFNGTKLTSVIIPDSVTTIGRGAFEKNYSLTSVKIGNNVTLIGEEAFSDCDVLKSITIPDSVTQMEYAFSGKCLSSINVSENNAEYCDIDGVLFNKEKTELLRYPNGKTDTAYTVPNSVTTIGDAAFLCCQAKSITIPSSVKHIRGRWVFEDSKTTDLYYSGSEQQWNELIEEQGVHIPSKATVHCNS